MNRKGQVYSVMAVMISIPIFLFIILFINSPLSNLEIEKVVADQMHEVQKSMEADFEKAVQTSIRRSIIAIINDIISTGNYTDNAVLRVDELANNGSLYGINNFILDNNTVPEWKEMILNVKTGFNTSFNFTKPIVTNYNGFTLLAKTNMTFNLTNVLNLSRIDKFTEKSIIISLDGAEDPLYSRNTGGSIERSIKAYPYSFYSLKAASGISSGADCEGEIAFSGTADPGKILVTSDGSGISGWRGVLAETGTPAQACYISSSPNAFSLVQSTVNATGFTRLFLENSTQGAWMLPAAWGIENRYYFSNSGPDIFRRLEGSLATSANGLFSIIYVPDFQGSGVAIKPGQIMVDYLYFSQSSNPGCKKVKGFPSWVLLDDAYVNFFGTQDLAFNVC